MKPEPNEYELAVKARNGDMNAVGFLVERLRSRLFGIAYAELGNFEDAQDATADTLLRICQHICDLREPGRFRYWADGIVRNEARRIATKRRFAVTLELSDLPVAGHESESLLRLDIQRALNRLPLNLARTLSLYYLDGAPMAEIAASTGRPVGTVKSWLHHGRKRLTTLLEEYAPMITTSAPKVGASPRHALLVHSELPAEMVDMVISGMRHRGYDTYVPKPEDYEDTIQAIAMFNVDQIHNRLTEFECIVFDETVMGLPALAQIINLRSDPSARDVLIYVLVDDVGNQTHHAMVAAYFNAGANGLILKDHTAEGKLRFSDEHTVIRWDRITPKAGHVLREALRYASASRASEVLTPHILIGIARAPECLGARLLVEHYDIDLEELLRLVTRKLSAAIQPHTPVDGAEEEPALAESCIQTIRFAQQEANAMRHTWLGAEHFLLGMLRQPDTIASEILTGYGLTVNMVKEQIALALKSLRGT